HSITKGVAGITDDVPLVDAHPELDPFVVGDLGVALGHASLQFDSAPHGIHDTRELHEHTVTGGLHDPPPVLGYLGVHQILSMALKLSERAFFVGPHEPRITSHIDCENGRKAPFYALSRQGSDSLGHKMMGIWPKILQSRCCVPRTGTRALH